MSMTVVHHRKSERGYATLADSSSHNSENPDAFQFSCHDPGIKGEREAGDKYDWRDIVRVDFLIGAELWCNGTIESPEIHHLRVGLA